MSQFRAPARYVQHDGALSEAGEHLARVDGTAALVAGGETALSNAGDAVLDGLAGAGIEHAGTVRGIEESTEGRISDIRERIRSAESDLVVGVGGCTAIDAAKAAAIREGTEFVAVPTLASADGPAGGLAVVYDEAGRPADLVASERNPALVLVDTGVVADAPARFLRWGLGDSISSAFEAEACAATGATTPHGVAPSATGLGLAHQTYETIRDRGADALADVERSEATPAVEAVVENTHLTSVLAWENGGLAGAHALETGLRASGITEPPHGILVGLCTLAQLVWQDHEERDTLAALLAELGFEDPIPSGADLEAGAAVGCEIDLMRNEPVEVTPGLALESLETARDLLASAR
jgi:glycerol dehydrogenase